jgi:WD40 repeat protein
MPLTIEKTLQVLVHIFQAVPLCDNRLASIHEDFRLRIWDLSTCEVLHSIDVGGTHRPLRMVALPDGRVATGGNDAEVKVWNTVLGTCEATYALPTRAKEFLALPDGRLACHTVSPDSHGTIHLFDTTSHTCTHTLEGHTCTIMALVLLPDGRLASGGLDEKVFVWDLATGARVGLSRGNVGGIRSMTVADSLLVCGKGNGDVSVFHWATFEGDNVEPLRTFNARSYDVSLLVPLPGGRLLTQCDDEPIRIWSLSTGEELAALAGEPQFDVHIVLLSDGRLATGGNESTFKLWDLDTYECIETQSATLPSNEEEDEEEDEDDGPGILSIAKLPGNRLLSVTTNNIVKVWGAGMLG